MLHIYSTLALHFYSGSRSREQKTDTFFIFLLSHFKENQYFYIHWRKTALQHLNDSNVCVGHGCFHRKRNSHETIQLLPMYVASLHFGVGVLLV